MSRIDGTRQRPRHRCPRSSSSRFDFVVVVLPTAAATTTVARGVRREYRDRVRDDGRRCLRRGPPLGPRWRIPRPSRPRRRRRRRRRRRQRFHPTLDHVPDDDAPNIVLLVLFLLPPTDSVGGEGHRRQRRRRRRRRRPRRQHELEQPQSEFEQIDRSQRRLVDDDAAHHRPPRSIIEGGSGVVGVAPPPRGPWLSEGGRGTIAEGRVMGGRSDPTTIEELQALEGEEHQ